VDVLEHAHAQLVKLFFHYCALALVDLCRNGMRAEYYVIISRKLPGIDPEEAKRLKEKVFPEYTIDILHSKMKPTEKDEVMQKFVEGKTHILVATSVVEVGVNVQNATIIVIEGAERFGLAQLHQLRGRVLRSNHQAYCYLFTDTKGAKTFARLKALVTAKNGFELSEMDLALRGSGELGGGKQWGISDLGMEAIKNIKMVEAAREEAKRLLTEDITLAAYPTLRETLTLREKPGHFE
jgi:ATP-dependent DNA helicase RecG